LLYFLLLGLLSLLLFAALFGYFVWRQKYREERQAREELVNQAQEMARNLEQVVALGRFLPERSSDISERSAQLLRVEARLINAVSVVVNRQGEVVAPLPLPFPMTRRLDTRLLAEGEIRSEETELPYIGKVLIVAVPLKAEFAPSFYNLVVAKRMQDLGAAYMGDLMRYVLIAGAAALLLSIALALYLSSSILKPLRRLSHAAWELAHGNLDSRVEPTGRDEIGELSGYFNYMAERVQRSAQLQKDFVANVSHEIRTPLTSIEGFSQALLDDMVETEEERRRYLNIICEESRRLKRLLAQLLTLSRIDAGAWVLRPAPLAIPQYLNEVSEKFQPMAREKGITLKVETPLEMPSIEADGDALEQVLGNLLDNALKFTPPGGEVTLSAHPLPLGGVRIQVRDNGQGIPEEELQRIFERFARVERSRSQRYGGSGLGLSLCRELLGLMGGAITAWSRPGRGSVFTVELPARSPHPHVSGSGAEG
jgi:signal transduction histidine kinase